jgi:putative ABC transport system permease protein
MTLLARLRSYMAALVRGRTIERDMEDEWRFHVEARADALAADGVPRDRAMRQALSEFGDPLRWKESGREARGLLWIYDVDADVRYGLRQLRRAPLFAGAAVITLALGIGANAAIFSVLNGVILRPLSYPKSSQLMYVTTQFPSWGQPQVPLSAPEYLEFREVTRSFAAIGAWAPGAGEVNLTANDGARRVRSVNVDEHLLHALGLQPAHGRFFAPGETDRSNPASPLPPVAILSYELWQGAFGGQPIVGKMVEVNSLRREVIGIMPPGADVMEMRPEIWLPLGLSPRNPGDRRAHRLYVIGRLKDDVTAEAAATEVRVLNDKWGERVGVTDHMFVPMPADAAARTSNPDAGHILQLRPLHDEIVRSASRAIWTLQIAAGLVLLIACANLGNLLLSRAAVRRRELAVRTALGASRRRLLRQFITEGALLSIAGSALALWIGRFGLHALTEAYPRALPRSTEVSVDLPVLLFTCGIAMVTSLFFGLAQLRHVGAKGLAVTLTEAGAKGAGGGTRRHVRRALVAGEVALAVILVTGAGLLIRTVYNLTNVELGFDRSRLVTFSVSLPERTYPEPVIRLHRYQRVLDALRAVPGVEAATAMWGLPPDRSSGKSNTRVADATVPSVGPFHIVDFYQYVFPDYFETMGVPIVRGRSFQPADASSAGLVAVVNETFAETFWKGQDPIGKRVKPCCNDQTPWFTVVGVAKDVKQGGVGQATGTELYMSVQQVARPGPGLGMAPLNHVVLRTTLTPAALAQTIERTVREQLDPSVPVVRLRDMETVLAESIQRPRFLAQLLGVFAGLALLLAAVGTYGVISSIVAERRSEIAIRMALGANRSSVVAHVMSEGLVLTGVGLGVGLAGAFGLNRLIASLLFGVRPTDVSTAAGVAATMILVAAVACVPPAWRASRLDPSAVLRA